MEVSDGKVPEYKVFGYNNKKSLWSKETDEERIIRIVKRDFEETFGISYDVFKAGYDKIVKESPEKLI